MASPVDGEYEVSRSVPDAHKSAPEQAPALTGWMRSFFNKAFISVSVKVGQRGMIPPSGQRDGVDNSGDHTAPEIIMNDFFVNLRFL